MFALRSPQPASQQRSFIFFGASLVLAAAFGCVGGAVADPPKEARKALSPRDEQLIELGRRLFFDPRVSRSGARSCASCHDPEHAFSDPATLSADDVGDTQRHSQTLIDSLRNPNAHWDGLFPTVHDLVLTRMGAGHGGGHGNEQHLRTLADKRIDARRKKQDDKSGPGGGTPPPTTPPPTAAPATAPGGAPGLAPGLVPPSAAQPGDAGVPPTPVDDPPAPEQPAQTPALPPVPPEEAPTATEEPPPPPLNEPNPVDPAAVAPAEEPPTQPPMACPPPALQPRPVRPGTEPTAEEPPATPEEPADPAPTESGDAPAAPAPADPAAPAPPTTPTAAPVNPEDPSARRAPGGGHRPYGPRPTPAPSAPPTANPRAPSDPTPDAPREPSDPAPTSPEPAEAPEAPASEPKDAKPAAPPAGALPDEPGAAPPAAAPPAPEDDDPPLPTAPALDLDRLPRVVDILESGGRYREGFAAAFGSDRVTEERIAEAIQAYVHSIEAEPAVYDRFVEGEPDALSPEARRGLALFRGRAGCAQCHSLEGELPTLTDYAFHNTGIAWKARGEALANGKQRHQELPAADAGRREVSRRNADERAFKTPTLRDVARRGPFMHDGSLATLKEVVRYYDQGGTKDPRQDPRLKPLKLSEEEIDSLVCFLESLNGERRAGLARSLWSERAEETVVRLVDARGRSLRGFEVRLLPVGDLLPGISRAPQAARTLTTDARGRIRFAPGDTTHVQLDLPDGLVARDGAWIPDTCRNVVVRVPVEGRVHVVLLQPADAVAPRALAAEHPEAQVLEGHDRPRTQLSLCGTLDFPGLKTSLYRAWVRSDVPSDAVLQLPAKHGHERSVELDLDQGSNHVIDLR